MDAPFFLFGQALEELRGKRKITQEKLAELVGVSQPTISKMENGKRMELRTLQPMLDALGVPFEDFLKVAVRIRAESVGEPPGIYGAVDLGAALGELVRIIAREEIERAAAKKRETQES